MSEFTKTIELDNSRFTINGSLDGARNTTMLRLLGHPRGDYSQECQGPTDPFVKSLMVERNVGPFNVHGLRPAVDTLEEILADIKEEEPEIYERLGHEGMLCCRFVKGSTSAISNHSWGIAIDLTIDGVLDERGDNRAQVGLMQIHKIFNNHQFYWGIAFPTEDAMHFEASDQLIWRWHQEGKLGDASVPVADDTLEFGDRSVEVAELQRSLSKALGIEMSPDGIFGSQTYEAVRVFQWRNNLVADGVVGKRTMEALRGIA
jgi:peptidoglycan hydrolase-like protein with peptidoglycan-binding domain